MADDLSPRARYWYNRFEVEGHENEVMEFTNEELGCTMLEAIQDERPNVIWALLKYARLSGWHVRFEPSRLGGEPALDITVGDPRDHETDFHIIGYVDAEIENE